MFVCVQTVKFPNYGERKLLALLETTYTSQSMHVELNQLFKRDYVAGLEQTTGEDCTLP